MELKEREWLQCSAFLNATEDERQRHYCWGLKPAWISKKSGANVDKLGIYFCTWQLALTLLRFTFLGSESVKSDTKVKR